MICTFVPDPTFGLFRFHRISTWDTAVRSKRYVSQNQLKLWPKKESRTIVWRSKHLCVGRGSGQTDPRLSWDTRSRGEQWVDTCETQADSQDRRGCAVVVWLSSQEWRRSFWCPTSENKVCVRSCACLCVESTVCCVHVGVFMNTMTWRDSTARVCVCVLCAAREHALLSLMRENYAREHVLLPLTTQLLIPNHACTAYAHTDFRGWRWGG